MNRSPFLEALVSALGFHARLLRRPSCPGGTRKPTRHIGRSVALLAQLHPKCPFQVGRPRPSVFTLLPSTSVLGSRPDYRDAAPTGSIRQSTYLDTPRVRKGEGPPRRAHPRAPTHSVRTARQPRRERLSPDTGEVAQPPSFRRPDHVREPDARGRSRDLGGRTPCLG